MRGIVEDRAARRRAHRRHPLSWSPRSDAPDAFATLAVGLLVSSMLLLAAALVYAASRGLLPDGPWGVRSGNHGPWRHVYVLRHLVFLSCFCMPSFAAMAAAASLVLRPSPRAAVTFLTVTGVFIGVFVSFYWLID